MRTVPIPSSFSVMITVSTPNASLAVSPSVLVSVISTVPVFSNVPVPPGFTKTVPESAVLNSAPSILVKVRTERLRKLRDMNWVPFKMFSMVSFFFFRFVRVLLLVDGEIFFQEPRVLQQLRFVCWRIPKL